MNDVQYWRLVSHGGDLIINYLYKYWLVTECDIPSQSGTKNSREI